MPELPEVEITRRKIASSLLGRAIAAVHTTAESYFFLTPPAELKRRLKGRTVTALTRHGKYLVAALDDGSRLLLHLGMTGQLFVQGSSSPRLLSSTARASLKPAEQAAFKPDHHTHLRIAFADVGPEVWFRDVRKFGKVKWLAKGESDERLDKLGPDALEVTGETLWQAGRKKSVASKNLLMDQAVIAGVGNIYADEALFRARIHPLRPADSLTPAEAERLYHAVQGALRTGIDYEGASVNWYRKPDGTTGESQRHFFVYGRAGEPCFVCGGPIHKLRVAQRGTHYCPVCQPAAAG